MRVALVHDWINGMRGGERCLSAFLDLYPDADIFTMLHVPGQTTEKIDARVKEVSFLNNLPGAQKIYRLLLPLYPFAIRSWDFSGYDLVISTSHAAAKNIRVANLKTIHICYCFTPMRYIWDQAYEYFGKLTPFLWPIIKLLRRWDVKGSDGVREFVAISSFISARIRCFYYRSSKIVYPPVSSEWIKRPKSSQSSKGEAFLYAGALVPYKKPDMVIAAFNQLKEPLWIIGSGPEEPKLRKMAGPNIKFLGRLSDKELGEYYGRCRALIFPGTEDFGMIPIECMAAGRPVIGYYDGALRETIKGVFPTKEGAARLDTEKATGVFIPKGELGLLSSLISSVYFFIAHEDKFLPGACTEQAERFSVGEFRRAWQEVVREVFSRLGKTPPA